MKEIRFQKSSNVFINTGIIALYDYLRRYEQKDIGSTIKIDSSTYSLSATELVIRHEDLYQLLEDIYYEMGKEVYDTATSEQLEKNENVYYVEETETFIRFPKISTLGLTNLLTNNAQGTTIIPDNTAKIANLKKSNPVLADKIEKHFEANNLKLLSKVYFNEPYTKITRLEHPIDSYFEEGSQICYLTGDSVKKLVDNQNISPFISGLSNFNSFLKGNDKKVSWKALYLSRFSPKFALYKYVAGLKGIVCYLFNSTDLLQLKSLIESNRGIFFTKNELLHAKYMMNFKSFNFYNKKGQDEALAVKNDYVEQSEISFILIYTIYRQLLFNQQHKGLQDAPEGFELIQTNLPDVPISLVSFRADEFSSTLRPNAFEEINNVKYLITLFSYLEKEQIDVGQILSSLKFLKPAQRSSQNSYQLERRVRSSVLSKILSHKSLLSDTTSLFYNCYGALISEEYVGYKNYNQLLKLIELYEPIISSNKNNDMTEKPEILQERAIKLGSSIGMSIVNYDKAVIQSEKEKNARDGRKYIIGLHKARNFTQFNEALIRLQKKYELVISGELLSLMNEGNFNDVKQYAIIGALNIINSTFRVKKEKNED
jgi:hypothetical protein